MNRSLTRRLALARPASPPQAPPRGLHLPDGAAGDAVGVPEEHGRRLMNGLPRPGVIFACGASWWWVVPAESQVGLDWPPTVSYWPDACDPRPDNPARSGLPAPRLIHFPEDAATPYTHPLLLYIAVCRLAGVPPVSAGAGLGAR